MSHGHQTYIDHLDCQIKWMIFAYVENKDDIFFSQSENLGIKVKNGFRPHFPSKKA